MSMPVGGRMRSRTSNELTSCPECRQRSTTLAFALRALGRHRDSRDAFDRLIREHPDFDAERLEQAEVYLDEATSRVAVIEILALADALRYRISFDGQGIEDDGDRPV